MGDWVGNRTVDVLACGTAEDDNTQFRTDSNPNPKDWSIPASDANLK